MPKLTFYYGTMNASKTTNLLMSAFAYGDKALIIKPSVDDREGKQTGWGKIESRVLKSSMPCYYTDKIDDKVLELIKDKQIVFAFCRFIRPAVYRTYVKYVWNDLRQQCC